MNKQAAFAASLAVLLVVLAVSAILFSTRKNRVELTGEVLKVRSFQTTQESTLALLDLRIKNPSTQQFVVRDLEIFVDLDGQEPVEASVFAETDAHRAVEFYTALGPKYTPGLVSRSVIEPEETMDRSLLIQVPLTDEQFDKRTGVRIVVEDVDGAVTTLAESR